MKCSIKYLLNAGVLCWMMWQIIMSFTLIIQYPTCDNVMQVVGQKARNTFLAFIPSLAILTILNYLIERKLEKRSTTHQYRVLLLIHIVVLAITFLTMAIMLRNNCTEF